MALDQRKFERKHIDLLRDVRPLWMRIADSLVMPGPSATVFIVYAASLFLSGWALAFADVGFVFLVLFFWWLATRNRSIAFKLPMDAPYKDKNNEGPGRSGEAEGILYLGNMKGNNEEIWFTNSDARTHVLYLGTTGSGKTEGLKSMVTNTLAWGSGFVYVDGKADTDLWSSLSSLCRRFGRDDDLLVLNYMTGNSDSGSPSNTMNPFSSGSASYLTNMLVELMPDAEGDNAMWKERAVSLCSSMMPALTWKRDNQDIPMSVRTIRDYLALNKVISLQRDQAIPLEIREGLAGYLDTLPGFVHDAYDDNGEQKPPGPDTPQYDTTTANQQHGYLAMQFTRALQSLGDDYGYIFDTQAADVDMMDIVLNRRILIVLIPALEKSGDEIANLGKIVAATMKGMMGSTLGSTVEGESAKVIENKPTHSATPFMTVFDEVGYYTAAGMAVMAAQARSLGFCLVFSGQDLPAMKKRVREEANSITANCNIKIFGKLEDPTETKEFFEKTVGQALVTEMSGYQMAGGAELGSYFDTQQASIQVRSRASYDGLRSLKEGESVLTFGETVIDAKMFYSNPGHAKSMRVTRFMSLPPVDEEVFKYAGDITELRDLIVQKNWTAKKAEVAAETPQEFDALLEGIKVAESAGVNAVDTGIMALVQVHGLSQPDDLQPAALDEQNEQGASEGEASGEKAASPAKPKKASAAPPAPSAPKDTEENTAPMSFFGGGHDDAGDKPQAPASAQPEATQVTQPTQATQKSLPQEIVKIIEDAARETRKFLFKDDPAEGDIDASQSGNVFLIILIGIALFSALAITVSRGMQSQSVSMMSARDAEVAAVDILSYAQKIERAVNRMRRYGISENDISFSNSVVSGYAHTPTQDDSNLIFNAGGGGLTWQSPASGVNDGSEWIITGKSCIADVGNGATGCDSDSASNEELILVLPAVGDTLCQKINDKLSISSIPADSGGGYSTTKFTGTYEDGTEIIPAGDNYTTACVSRGGANFFYSVLIER